MEIVEVVKIDSILDVILNLEPKRSVKRFHVECESRDDLNNWSLSILLHPKLVRILVPDESV